MRASDDGGATWGADVYNATVRRTVIDGNGSSWASKWTVDRFTATSTGVATLAFTKYSGLMVAPEEVFFLSSPNLLSEPNASAVMWDTMPAGPHGLAPPGGNPGISAWAGRRSWRASCAGRPSPPFLAPVEEGHVVPLAALGYFMVARTSQGFLAAASTADPSGAGGWTATGGARYWSATPVLSNRLLKQPRGPVQLRRMANGRYLLLFYFNSNAGFDGRNPCG